MISVLRDGDGSVLEYWLSQFNAVYVEGRLSYPFALFLRDGAFAINFELLGILEYNDAKGEGACQNIGFEFF